MSNAVGTVPVMTSPLASPIDLRDLQLLVAGSYQVPCRSFPGFAVGTWVAELVHTSDEIDPDDPNLNPLARVVLLTAPLRSESITLVAMLDSHSEVLSGYEFIAEDACLAGFDRLVVLADVVVQPAWRHRGLASIATLFALEQVCVPGDMVAHRPGVARTRLDTLEPHPAAYGLGKHPTLDPDPDDGPPVYLDGLIAGGERLGFEQRHTDSWVLYPEGQRFRRARSAIRSDPKFAATGDGLVLPISRPAVRRRLAHLAT